MIALLSFTISPPDYRLSAEIRRVISKAGFAVVYVNHVDKWETHYKLPDGEGWRVSYPHKRGGGEKSILVEAVVPTWPKEWFDTGYAVVRVAK